jgi:hypothetical protein
MSLSAGASLAVVLLVFRTSLPVAPSFVLLGEP